ncbi:MAG: hypothetical protein MHM6MM_003129 [Cercozoa sp. M6MM]
MSLQVPGSNLGGTPPSPSLSSVSSRQSASQRPVQAVKPMPRVTLHKSRQEREKYDKLADLYALLMAVEKLEQMYARGNVDAKEYEAQCFELIRQYKTMEVAIQQYVPDIHRFVAEHSLQVGSAINRLVNMGSPATVFHAGANSGADQKDQVNVAAAVQHFITAMDALKVGMFAVDQVLPELQALSSSLNAIGGLADDHACKAKLRDWLVQMNRMRAHDELSEEQVRQLDFDLNQAYESFTKFLKSTTH